MARPAMRDPSGRWSLTQIAAAAGLSRQTARTLTTAGYLTADNLGYKDITIAKVAAALIDGPRPTGLTKTDTDDTLIRRNFEALRLTRQVLDNPTPPKDTTLLISPTTAALHESPFKLMADIEGATTPLLLLPVGTWAHELRTTLIVESQQRPA